MGLSKFKQAQQWILQFGKYKGLAIDKIAETDEGLKYLDWLNDQTWLQDPLKSHLVNYLSDPTIKKELDAST